jgi:hypothetical protein
VKPWDWFSVKMGSDEMASQRMLIATLAGEAATETAKRFASWRGASPSAVLAVDHFCEALRANAVSLSILYFAEWMDRWLMGDRVPGPGAVCGRRFEATCLTCAEAVDWAGRCGDQWQEQQWLAARLREAATRWTDLAQPQVVVIVREVFDGSALDEDIEASFRVIPPWLPDLPK